MRELTEIYCQRACNDGLLKYFYLSQNRKSLQHFILTSKDSCSFDVRTCFQESVMTAGYNGYYRVPWSRADGGQIPAAGQVLYPLQAWIYSSCLPQRIVVKIKWDFFSPHSDLQIVRFQNVSSHYDCHHHHHHHHHGSCVDGEHCPYWCFSCIKLWYSSKPL